jgi:nucleotide-binding universal stress UspA family protein
VIKRILLPLDPSPYSTAALNMACTIAKVYDAEITGLVILDIPGIMDSIGPVPIGGIHRAEKLEQEKKDEAKQRIESLLKSFKEKCRSEGIRYKEAERQGSPSEKIIEESVYYDVVIAGLRTYYNFETSDTYGQSLDRFLKEAVTPVFGIPENMPVIKNFDRKIKVLIAFDGSLLAARALQRFASLINPKLYDITLFNASDDQVEGESLLKKAEEYLNAHGIENVTKDWVKGDVINIIESDYYDKMDGFVVGAHARSGVFDFLIGSLTKFLVRKADKLVFIGQ